MTVNLHQWKIFFDMHEDNDVSGLAALSIVESLLLALKDRKLLSEQEIAGLLQDTERAHRDVPGTDAEKALHRAVALTIKRVAEGNNSIRRGTRDA